MKFATKQYVTFVKHTVIGLVTQSPRARSVSAQIQRSLRQFNGKFTANPRRLQYESTKNVLQIEKNLSRLKSFCLLVTPLKMR